MDRKKVVNSGCGTSESRNRPSLQNVDFCSMLSSKVLAKPLLAESDILRFYAVLRVFGPPTPCWGPRIASDREQVTLSRVFGRIRKVPSGPWESGEVPNLPKPLF